MRQIYQLPAEYIEKAKELHDYIHHMMLDYELATGNYNAIELTKLGREIYNYGFIIWLSEQNGLQTTPFIHFTDNSVKINGDGNKVTGENDNSASFHDSFFENSPISHSATTTPNKKDAKIVWYKSWWFTYIVCPILVALLGAFIIYKLRWNN